MISPLILEHYSRYLKTSHTCRSELSRRDYLLALDLFSRAVEGDVFTEIREYQQFHFALEALADRTEWPGGKKKKIWGSLYTYKVATAVICFFRWARAFNFTPHQVYLSEPAVGHLFKKGIPKDPEWFDWSDPVFHAVLYDPNNTYRESAMWQTLRASGVRISEMCHLKITDLNLEERTFRIACAKGGLPAVAPMDEECQANLRLYLSYRNSIYDGEWLFPLEDFSGPVTPDGVRKMLWNRKKKYGVRYNPHKWRHSLGGEMLSNGADLGAIAEVLRHKDLRTTRRYTHLSGKRKVEMLDKYTNRNLAAQGIQSA